MNYFYFMAFFVFFILFLNLMDVKVIEMAINVFIRCLSGIVFIIVANYILRFLGINLMVNINQISMVVSGTLGISGVGFLYLFRWILTTAM